MINFEIQYDHYFLLIITIPLTRLTVMVLPGAIKSWWRNDTVRLGPGVVIFQGLVMIQLLIIKAHTLVPGIL